MPYHILIQPPLVQHSNRTLMAVFLGVMIVALVALTGGAVRRRVAMLPVLFLGAGLAGFVEAQLDLLSRVSWASNLPKAYTVYGRPIPSLVLPTYALVIGGGMYLTYWLCTRGATRRQLFKLFITLSAVESVFEMITMTTHLWKYYGPQPLDVFGFPLYWGALNGASMVVTGVLIYGLRGRFAGRGVWAAVLVPPLAFGMDFAVAWPTWDVMNTRASVAVMSLVSLLTIGLCISEVWFTAGLFAAKPAEADGPTTGAETMEDGEIMVAASRPQPPVSAPAPAHH